MTETTDEPTKEAVYDAEIAPLMAQIIATCKRRKIAMLADFHLGDELHCTTGLLADEYDPSDEQERAMAFLRPGRVPTLTLTIRDGAGAITNMEAIVG